MSKISNIGNSFSFEAVLEIYEQRKSSPDRHNHYTVDDFMNICENLEG